MKSDYFISYIFISKIQFETTALRVEFEYEIGHDRNIKMSNILIYNYNL